MVYYPSLLQTVHAYLGGVGDALVLPLCYYEYLQEQGLLPSSAVQLLEPDTSISVDASVRSLCLRSTPLYPGFSLMVSTAIPTEVCPSHALNALALAHP
jgi:hypothetical protein